MMEVQWKVMIFFVYLLLTQIIDWLFLVENLFNLKFAAKELERSAKKCEKDSVAEKGKLKRVGLNL